MSQKSKCTEYIEKVSTRSSFELDSIKENTFIKHKSAIIVTLLTYLKIYFCPFYCFKGINKHKST